MGGALRLRRGVVVSADPLLVEVDGERRRAWVDERLLGEARVGDEVVVNVAALELGLGSGGFDIVHANLTRLAGGAGEGDGDGARGGDAAGPEPHVMKLNYSSLQHAVEPVERGVGEAGGARTAPIAVLPLHGHLAPAAWAAARAQPGLRIGYVQTAGGALPGPLSRDVAELRRRGLLCGHVTAAPAYGGEHEALSVLGAIDAAVNRLGWEAVLVGPGPGIIGSETAYGHGGMAALDSAHAALALGLPTLLSPRLSASDPRERHRGLSHHTRTVLSLLLAPVRVAVPAGERQVRELLAAAAGERHEPAEAPVDLDAYAASGLPTTTMGRTLTEDPLFFAAPLATGTLLARSATRP